MDSAAIVALSTVLSAAISAIVTYYLGRRKAAVESKGLEAVATKAVADAYSVLISDLTKQITSLYVRVSLLEVGREQLEAKIAKLQVCIEELEVENRHLQAENRSLRFAGTNG